MNPHDLQLIGSALVAIVTLVLLITWLKINPFLALLLSSLLLGGSVGQPLPTALKSFEDGLGATMAGVAAVIGLGVMLGKLLENSGGAEVLAQRFNTFFGPARAAWCMIALGLVIGLATWFVVGLMLLLPILLTLTRESKRPFLLLALPLVACLSVMHGLMPPHPGPVLACAKLQANTGGVLLWGFAIGVPMSLIGGPLFARWVVNRVPAEAPESARPSELATLKPPGFGLTLWTMLLPVVLMLLATLANLLLEVNSRPRAIVAFIGNPTIALTIAVLFSLWSFGTRCGYDCSQLLKFTEDSVARVGMAILVVGGGGGFARVLRDAGVAGALGNLAQLCHLPPLVYAFLIAAFIRVATGSATVAITAAAEMLAPSLVDNPGINRELLVIAVGCGSLILSHLNDGGFWIVKDCLGFTVAQTLRTWTIMETIVGFVGLLLTLTADFIWRMFATNPLP